MCDLNPPLSTLDDVAPWQSLHQSASHLITATVAISGKVIRMSKVLVTC